MMQTIRANIRRSSCPPSIEVLKADNYMCWDHNNLANMVRLQGHDAMLGNKAEAYHDKNILFIRFIHILLFFCHSKFFQNIKREFMHHRILYDPNPMFFFGH